MGMKAARALSWRADARGSSSHCLLIQPGPLPLLVPRILVAEVLNPEGLSRQAWGATGRLEAFAWRGRIVPLLPADPALAGLPDASQGTSKVLVMHALRDRARLPFYALAVSANPRLVLVKADSLEAGDGELPPAALSRVRLEGGAVLIPDVDAFEDYLLERLPSGATVVNS